jgi:hypothetical protein
MKSTRAEWIGRVYELGGKSARIAKCQTERRSVGRDGGTWDKTPGCGVGRTPGLGLLTRRTA